jgi:polyisoprenoid-binding protein YceI
MKQYLPLIILLFLSNLSLAQKHQSINGSVTFIIKNTGLNVDGSISGLQGNIDFDMEQPSNSKIIVTIDPATIDTGVGLRDKHLKKEYYFDVDQYQVIKMESTSIVKKIDGYEGIFELTMKGVTKAVSIPFTVTKENERLIFKADFEINRRDFNVGDNIWVLSDKAKVKVELVVK